MKIYKDSYGKDSFMLDLLSSPMEEDEDDRLQNLEEQESFLQTVQRS